MRIKVYKTKCLKCDFQFFEFDDEVKQCPNCKESTVDAVDDGEFDIEICFENHKNRSIIKINTDLHLQIKIERMNQNITVGTIVHHKKDPHLKFGKVVSLSKTGKRAEVHWPVGPKLPLGHRAYYPVEALVPVE